MRHKFLPCLGLFLLIAGTAHGLTLSDAITQIRRNIRDTATDTTLQRYSDTFIANLINEAQRDVVNRTWIVSNSYSVSLVADTTYYTLPTDTIAIERVTIDDANIPEITIDQMDFESDNTSWETTGGTPLYFFQDKSQRTQIGLTPYPTSGGTLNIIYYCMATDLSAGDDTPFNADTRLTKYHDLLVLRPTYQILLIEGRSDLAKQYLDDYNVKIDLINAIVGAYKPITVSGDKAGETK